MASRGRSAADAAMSNSVSSGDMSNEMGPNKFDTLSANTGPQQFALSTGQVTFIDYESHLITIRVTTGEELQFEPQALPQAAAGHRHFLGAMPEVGDVCLVGWGQSISGRTKTPYVLRWLVPGVTSGHDWLPTQPYSPGDFGFTATEKARFEGIADRVRHKLRHLEPGDVFGMSSRGADILLNESIQITNRRGNEIHLRDQDQAIIFRSLQQFHAMSGARIYAGMVQRDAGMLPNQMFSDGTYWDSPRVVDGASRPLSQEELATDPVPVLGLTPAEVFARDRGGQRNNAINLGSLDPYQFLQRGLFIGADGQALEDSSSEAVYGGKSMYRVSMDNSNSVIDPSVETLTEYRIEVSHTADGTLPVTEQTDGFDADRLPSAVPTDAAPLGGSEASPFIEFVMGSVIGNDPFNNQGRALYGVPLRPVVFDGVDANPGMKTGLGFPMEEHAAVMLKIAPPLSTTGTSSFWAWTKDGRLLKSVVGPGGVYSAEENYGSGLRVGIGATTDGDSYRLDTKGAIVLHNERGSNATNMGVEVTSDRGAIRIYGGGSTTVGGSLARSAPVGEGDKGLPAVSIESATNMHLTAAKTLKISAQTLDLKNVAQMNLSGSSSLQLSSGTKVATQSKVIETTAMGSLETNISGPRDSLPTNMPVRSTSIVATPATGNPGGLTDKYTMTYGNRRETITAGNHTTRVAVGNQTYSTGAGVVKMGSAANSVEVTTGGITGTAAAGAVTFAAPAGAASITATARASITGATVGITGPAVTISGGHTFPGGVMTDTCINPLTGAPFTASGTLGVPTVRIIP